MDKRAIECINGSGTDQVVDDAWCAHDAWCMVCTWCMVHGARCIVHHSSYIVYDAWCMMCDARHVKSEVWCMMHGVCCIMHYVPCIMPYAFVRHALGHLQLVATIRYYLLLKNCRMMILMGSPTVFKNQLINLAGINSFQKMDSWFIILAW